MADTHYYYALGRRKRSTARIRLMHGKGNVLINGKLASDYFNGSKAIMYELIRPFAVLDLESNKYDISAVVRGGGYAGQADAIRLAIARALAVMNEDFKGTLRRTELLGRDPREKERKKFGLKGARKQRQFTKR